ncbi:MAG: ATP-binding cassette domain-containing protein, partial [Planctomycetes bacterium]|nr:ATP-binding cassette domain-containing protein [Planctomycetota bacterium]
MNDVVKATGVEVRFGKKRVLDGLDFELQPGQVTVLLGQNGSGKSTWMRLLLGLLRPRRGEVRVFGKDPVRAHREVLARVGYVPDVPDVYPWMTAKDLFKFLSRQYAAWNPARVQQLCEQLDVPTKTRFKSMSRGQGMKAMLVAALAPEPELLLLDEPFAG